MLVSQHPVVAARRSATGLWSLVIAGVLWGTGGLTGSLLAVETGLSPLAVAAYRLAVGGILIGVFLVVTRRPWPCGRAAWGRITVIGLLAAAFQSCYFAAVSLATVSIATLLTIGASPVIVLAVEWGAGRRRVGLPILATVTLAVTGLTLLIGIPAEGANPTSALAGAGLALLSAGGFATITLVSARPMPGLDELTTTGLGFTIGAATLAPLAAATGGLTFVPSPAAVGLLLLLGTAPTAVAYALYFRGLRTTTASAGALMALLEPLVGTALAILILGDRLTPTGLVGAGLLTVALLLNARTPDR